MIISRWYFDRKWACEAVMVIFNIHDKWFVQYMTIKVGIQQAMMNIIVCECLRKSREVGEKRLFHRQQQTRAFKSIMFYFLLQWRPLRPLSLRQLLLLLEDTPPTGFVMINHLSWSHSVWQPLSQQALEYSIIPLSQVVLSWAHTARWAVQPYFWGNLAKVCWGLWIREKLLSTDCSRFQCLGENTDWKVKTLVQNSSNPYQKKSSINPGRVSSEADFQIIPTWLKAEMRQCECPQTSGMIAQFFYSIHPSADF